MTTTPPRWDPQAPEVLRDQRAAYDQLRERCPLAHSDAQHWSVLRHAEVMQVLGDHATFSSAVSAHPAVPNGYDQPLHTQYRRALDPFFAPERMAHFEPVCRALSAATVQEALALGGELEITHEFALPFAVRVQSAFLGWPTLLQDELLGWLRRSQAATRSGDRTQTSAVAQEFEDLVGRVRQARLEAPPTQDITSELMHTRVEGRLLDLRELASVLRTGRWARSARLPPPSASCCTGWRATPTGSNACARSPASCPRPSTRCCASTARSWPTAASPPAT